MHLGVAFSSYITTLLCCHPMGVRWDSRRHCLVATNSTCFRNSVFRTDFTASKCSSGTIRPYLGVHLMEDASFSWFPSLLCQAVHCDCLKERWTESSPSHTSHPQPLCQCHWADPQLCLRGFRGGRVSGERGHGSKQSK